MTPSILHRPELLALARSQHWVLALDQLRAFGATREQIRHLVRAGRLFRVHRGVYAVGRPDLAQPGRWMAGVLAAGPDALLGGRAAGRLWALLERGGEAPEVLVPAHVNRTPGGVLVHRSGTLLPGDATRRDGIPVTGLQRTLLDLARLLDARELKSAVRQAQRVHRLDLRPLHARTASPRTDVACARLHALLDLYVPVELTQSELEAEFLELCVRHRIPLPDLQRRFGAQRADFTWSDLRLVVEVDGRGTHDTDVAFLEDRVRDRRRRAEGFEPLRFTWPEVVHRPGEVARELLTAMARRRSALGLAGSGGS